MDFKDFIYWEMASKDTIDFKKVYVDMSDDLVAGLLLSQIVFWHLPNKDTNRTKLRVEKEGKMWIAKGRHDWWDEIRITAKQFDRAIAILEKKDLVESEVFKFGENTRKHVRLNEKHFLMSLEHQLEVNARMAIEGEKSDEPYSPLGIDERVIPEFTKREFRSLPKGNSGIDERVIPSYTENTIIDYFKDYLSENAVDENLLDLINLVFGNTITVDRKIDVIESYKLYADELSLIDFKKILISIKSQMSRIKKNFKNYVVKSIHTHLTETKAEQKEPTKKDIVPEWINGTQQKKDANPDFEEEKKKLEEELKQYRKRR